MYKPNPIDTNDVVLPKELTVLTEQIAENVHEVWAAGRIRDGWTYGAERDDETKTTPCLVPYDQLPDGEKEYDHRTVIETIRLIIKLGWQILPPKDSSDK